jgi:hypothetical protein
VSIKRKQQIYLLADLFIFRACLIWPYRSHSLQATAPVKEVLTEKLPHEEAGEIVPHEEAGVKEGFVE